MVQNYLSSNGKVYVQNKCRETAPSSSALQEFNDMKLDVGTLPPLLPFLSRRERCLSLHLATIVLQAKTTQFEACKILFYMTVMRVPLSLQFNNGCASIAFIIYTYGNIRVPFLIEHVDFYSFYSFLDSNNR